MPVISFKLYITNHYGLLIINNVALTKFGCGTNNIKNHHTKKSNNISTHFPDMFVNKDCTFL